MPAEIEFGTIWDFMFVHVHPISIPAFILLWFIDFYLKDLVYKYTKQTSVAETEYNKLCKEKTNVKAKMRTISKTDKMKEYCLLEREVDQLDIKIEEARKLIPSESIHQSYCTNIQRASKILFYCILYYDYSDLKVCALPESLKVPYMTDEYFSLSMFLWMVPIGIHYTFDLFDQEIFF